MRQNFPKFTTETSDLHQAGTDQTLPEPQRSDEAGAAAPTGLRAKAALTDAFTADGDKFFDRGEMLCAGPLAIPFSNETLVHMDPRDVLHLCDNRGDLDRVHHTPGLREQLANGWSRGNTLPVLSIRRMDDGEFQVRGAQGLDMVLALEEMQIRSIPVRVAAPLDFFWGQTNVRPKTLFPESGYKLGFVDFPAVESYPNGAVSGDYSQAGVFGGYSREIRERFELAEAVVNSTGTLVAPKFLNLSGLEDFTFEPLVERGVHSFLAMEDVDMTDCRAATLPEDFKVHGTLRINGCYAMADQGLPKGLDVGRLNGTMTGSEGTRMITWLGAEMLERTWSYHHFDVDRRTAERLEQIGTQLTVQQAWDLFKIKEQQPGGEHLVIVEAMGGGSSEASDDDCYTVWPPHAVEYMEGATPEEQLKAAGWFHDKVMNGLQSGPPTALEAFDKLVDDLEALLAPRAKDSLVGTLELQDIVNRAKAVREGLVP